MATRKLFMALFYSLLIAGCSKVMPVESTTEIEEFPQQLKYYDKDSKLNYQISNNDTHLRIMLKASDPMTMRKMTSTGMTIYFDPAGKKKKNVYLTYPIQQTTELPIANMMRNAPQNQKERPDLSKMLLNIPPSAEFVNGEEVHFLNLDTNKEFFEVTLSASGNSELMYDLKIPFETIHDAGISELSNLSIGIVSGKFEMPNMMGVRPQGIGGRAGGMRPGGMAGRGGRPSGMPGGRPDVSSLTTEIEIWVKPQLR